MNNPQTPRRNAIIAVLLLVVSLLAGCAMDTPRGNINQIPFPIGAERLSLRQLEDAVFRAAANREWAMAREAPGRLKASFEAFTSAFEAYRITALINLNIDQQLFSVEFADVNMLRFNDGNSYQRYTQWVTDMQNDISREIALAAVTVQTPGRVPRVQLLERPSEGRNGFDR